MTPGVKQPEYPRPIRLVTSVLRDAMSANSASASSSVAAAGRSKDSCHRITSGTTAVVNSAMLENPTASSMRDVSAALGPMWRSRKSDMTGLSGVAKTDAAAPVSPSVFHATA